MGLEDPTSIQPPGAPAKQTFSKIPPRDDPISRLTKKGQRKLADNQLKVGPTGIPYINKGRSAVEGIFYPEPEKPEEGPPGITSKGPNKRNLQTGTPPPLNFNEESPQQGGKKRTKKGKKAKKNKSKKAKKSASRRSIKKHAKRQTKKHAKKHTKKH